MLAIGALQRRFRRPSPATRQRPHVANVGRRRADLTGLLLSNYGLGQGWVELVGYGQKCLDQILGVDLPASLPRT